jgi:hypothetical protein
MRNNYLKKGSALIISYFLLTILGFSQITEPVWNGLVEYCTDTTGLEIDGYAKESFWSASIPVDGLFAAPSDFGGDSDLSGYFKMFYTTYAFYFFASITDDIANNFNGEDGYIWEFDNIQLYFNLDTANSYKSGSYYPDGIQLFFSRGLDDSDGAPLFGNDEPSKTNFDNPSLKYEQIDNTGEWQIELELPWNYMLPSGSKPEDIIEYIGKTIGFDVTFSDSDGSDPVNGNRDAMLALDYDGLMGDEDNAWMDVRKFGLLELSVDTKVVTSADAGNDQQIVSDGKDEYQVELNAEGSKGGFGSPLDFVWSSPDDIEIEDSTLVSPTVTLPFSGFTTKYTFVLQVTDTNDVSDTDTVYVMILNNPPIADAGEDQVVLPYNIVKLDGSGSSDIEQNSLIYLWNSLSSIELSDKNSISPTFEAPNNQKDTTYSFTLKVSDGEYFSQLDTVSIFVESLSGIHKNSEENIIIYPNPASRYLGIHVNNNTYLQCFFTLTDINGKQLYQGKIAGSETVINILDCGIIPNNLYFIRIYDSEGGLVQAEKIFID